MTVANLACSSSLTSSPNRVSPDNPENPLNSTIRSKLSRSYSFNFGSFQIHNKLSKAISSPRLGTFASQSPSLALNLPLHLPLNLPWSPKVTISSVEEEIEEPVFTQLLISESRICCSSTPQDVQVGFVQFAGSWFNYTMLD